MTPEPTQIPGAGAAGTVMQGIRGAFSRRKMLGGTMAVGLGSMLAACGADQVAKKAAPTGPPQRGGHLRVGLTGGGAADTLDPHSPVSTTDIARIVNLYEPLLYWNHDYELKPAVATKVEPSADALRWTAHIRKDIVFHDGRPVTGNDVKATFARITNPEDPKSGATTLAPLIDHIEVVDTKTVVFHLKTPSAIFDDTLGQYANGIVPADFNIKHPIGTGAFEYESFTPGQRSTFVRNDQYWRDNEPHLDKLTILNFNDDDALTNALLSTQVDAVGQIPLALVEVIGADPRINVLNSETGMWLPFTMRVDRKPFDDKRVRQAFRLAVDREQMIQQVLSGYGRVANDLYAPYDPGYAQKLPQRKQDIKRAKKLLADAGYPDGLSVELVTAPIQSGAVEAAQVFAQQAKAAGINVNIRRVETTTFFGENYLEWDFAQDFWYTRNFLPQAKNGSLPQSPFNETHWDNKKFQQLVAQAVGTIDDDQRNALIAQAQGILYDEGGYIIWGFANQADAYQRYVAGLIPNRTGLALSGFEFRRVWLGGDHS